MRGARRSTTSGAGVRRVPAPLAALWIPGLVACSSPAPPGEPGPGSPPAVAAPARPSSAAPPASAAPQPAAGLSGAPTPTNPPEAAARRPPPPAISAAEAADVLFPGALASGHARRACPEASAADAERIRCMIAERYRTDDEARRLALDIYRETGSVAGVEREHVMDGGFRGKLHLVPEPPVARHRKHLAWVAAAAADFTWFFGELESRAGRASAAGAPAGPPLFRHQPIAWRFFRSVGRTTPSAYASGWTVAYNVSGSLLRSEDATRETLFHEIFHLNDGARAWSRRALGAIYDGIVARCGARTACLTPYAPTTTKVRGGTYYAFQPDNGDGVHEYAAEIAMRYYQDHRALLRGDKLAGAAFKCGPAESAKAWSLLVEEFFGGVDLVPAC